jgi:hypothetical protein
MGSRRPVHKHATLSAALALGFALTAPQAAAASVPDGPHEVTRAPTGKTGEGRSGVKTERARPTEDLPKSDSGLWIVQLEEPPLATYRGGISGLRATSPQATGRDRLNVAAPASIAYVDHLADSQAELVQDMEATLGHDIKVTTRLRHAFNGLVIRVQGEEAELLADLPGVATVVPDQKWRLDTDVSNEIINSPAIWTGATGPSIGTRGEGVVVGMLDTGVNPDHPSFAAVDGDGYVHQNPYGSGNYVGVCAPAASRHEDICNDKLIGAWNFTGALSARDDNGHGSHTGSTMAGNKHDAVFTIGEDTYTRPISGVAPRANVISYKVCSFSCLSSASVAAVNQAIIDGADVLNYSISGPDDPWDNPVDAAFLAASEAGVFVSASAGNDGPGAGTVAKTAPWNAAVAATNSPRLIAHDVSVVGPGPVPEELTSLGGVPGTGPAITSPVQAELREASVVDDGNIRGCEGFPAGAFDGSLALIERGDCNFSVKVDNAADAGAVGVIMANQFVGPPVVMGALENTDIPSVMVANADGIRLREYVVANPGTVARIDSSTVLAMHHEWERMITDFSSRGPSDFDLLAPTFAAPGRNILAATMAADGETARYEFMQGTSMASPHGAGAGALMRALHPDWSPAEIRSALASTADDEGMLKDDGVTATDPFDTGSGLLDLDAAGRVGLVMDESTSDFQAADPEAGGDPRTLNLPAFVDQNCLNVCTFTREVVNVADAQTTYTAAIEAPNGVSLTVQPAQFTIAPNAAQVVTVTADMSSLVGGDYLFGDVALTTDGTHAGGAEIADVHYPVVLVKAEAQMVVEPTELSSLLGVDEQEVHSVTVTNDGGAPMQWQVSTEGAGCAPAEWVHVDPVAGSLAAGESQDLSATFDSSDMAGGTYSSALCLASNDPHRPVAEVSLTLEVVEIPVIDLDTDALTSTQPAGVVTKETMSIGNTGYGLLDWTLEDSEAGPSDERIELLRQGVLLVPNSASSNRGVMAFDRQDGTLIDTEFIPHHPYAGSSLYTPNHVLPTLDGTGFLVADQVRHVVTEYDLDGNFRGFFAPNREGEDRTIMQNIRGMAWSPEGTLLVTVASGVNANSIVEFDQDGNYLGHFIEPDLGGMEGPWFLTFRDEDLLVAANGSQAVHSFSRDGSTPNQPFATNLNWPEQVAELDNGNILVANWRGTSSTLPSGIHEFGAAGNHIGHYQAPGSAYAGVHPLGNGNMLVTTDSGVYEIDRAGSVSEQEQAGGRGRFISDIQMPDLLPCVTPDEVPWLEVDAASGRTGRGEVSNVTVSMDSTGLAAGEHTVQLCVSSDDPATPYVPVKVSLTVTDAVCDTVVSDVHEGPLTVTGGLACLGSGSQVDGPVWVRDGAGLWADSAHIVGALTAVSTSQFEVTSSVVDGRVTVRGGNGPVTLDSITVGGPVTVEANNTGDHPAVIAGNVIAGTLWCYENIPPPINDGRPNTVEGTKRGQCRNL